MILEKNSLSEQWKKLVLAMYKKPTRLNQVSFVKQSRDNLNLKAKTIMLNDIVF